MNALEFHLKTSLGYSGLQTTIIIHIEKEKEIEKLGKKESEKAKVRGGEERERE